jgi:hypothetical protein
MKAHGFKFLKEPQDLKFQPSMLNQSGNVYIDGYWQSEDYFIDVADTIRDDFNLAYSVNLPNFLSTIDAQIPLVSLHVRRGDYVHNSAANSVHGVLGLDYYYQAIDHLADCIGQNFHILVFSDDIKWAQENLQFTQSCSFMIGSATEPHNDLYMMKSCDHHIIANSSFSWWGAWLNPSKSKIVIAPKRWFISPQFEHCDICPPSWVRI